MYFLKPLNILTVTRFKLFAVSALVTFWAFFFSFFLAPIWATAICALLHLLTLLLAFHQGYKLLVYLFLSQQEGGDSAPRVKTDARTESPN